MTECRHGRPECECQHPRVKRWFPGELCHCDALFEAHTHPGATEIPNADKEWHTTAILLEKVAADFEQRARELRRQARICRQRIETDVLAPHHHRYPEKNGQGFPELQCLDCGEWRYI